jgi:hypothetical protein
MSGVGKKVLDAYPDAILEEGSNNYLIPSLQMIVEVDSETIITKEYNPLSLEDEDEDDLRSMDDQLNLP